MKTKTIVVAVVSVLLSSWATEGNARTKDDKAVSGREREAIEAMFLQYQKTLNESNVDCVLERYGPDGVFMTPDRVSITGSRMQKQ